MSFERTGKHNEAVEEHVVELVLPAVFAKGHLHDEAHHDGEEDERADDDPLVRHGVRAALAAAVAHARPVEASQSTPQA